MERFEGEEDIRMGVYACHCGGNISDVVDMKAVTEAVRKNTAAAVVRDYPFMCSDPGQGLIIEDIRQNRINRVVVAACAPALHEVTFRNALGRAGLNPYLYEHVNIREQVSWVHKKVPHQATEKAVRLIRAGIEKVSRQDPLYSIQVNAEPGAVIIGGGVAGLMASLSLARRGLKVTLIEKEAAPGGKLNDMDTLFPAGLSAPALIKSLVGQVEKEENITLLVGTRVASVGGYVGNFTVKTDRDHEIRAGVIIIATGYRNYVPREGEAGFAAGSQQVITLPEFIRHIPRESPGSKVLEYKGKKVNSLAFIHCVGSMQREGLHQPSPDGHLNDYCSRCCCAAALHTINIVLDRFPATQVYDIYRDMRTYGRGQEEYYENAAKKGTLFFRCADDSLPEVRVKENGCEIVVNDVLTWGEEVSIPADLVVLVTGMTGGDIPELIDSLKLPLGADRFLQEVHPKLRPVELANNGIFIAGSCQGPMNIPEASAAAEAAAVKASILLSSPVISLDPFVASVNAGLCDGCGLCVKECGYEGALVVKEREGGGSSCAEVNAALCKGCGACAAVCPHRAIMVAGWTLDQFDAMVDAIVAPLQE